MGQRVELDEFDLAAMSEGAAIRSFRTNIGESIGRIGTPKNKAKIRYSKADTNQHRRQGAKPGVWKGL